MIRLSEHILLGDSLKQPDAWKFFDEHYDQPGCKGCALFGAILSAGIAKEYRIGRGNGNLYLYQNPAIRSLWPWLTWEHEASISEMYMEVVEGNMTIYQLADEVRKWEDELGVYNGNSEQEAEHTNSALGEASSPVLETNLLEASKTGS